MAVPKWLKQPRTMLLTVAPAVAIVGIGTFYMFKKRQRIVTVTASPAQVALCHPATVAGQTISNIYELTVTITDGFGNPLSDEEFTLNTYLAGTLKATETYRTGPDGTWSTSLCWECPACPTQHIDTEERITVTHSAECKGAKGSANVTIVAPVCLNLPCTCA